MTTSFVRLLFCVVIFFALANVKVFGQAKAIEIFDASSWDYKERISLNGKWTVIEGKLIGPEQVESFYAKSAVRFPLLWNDLRLDETGVGCATYALRVLLPPTNKRLAIEIPQLYSSYKLWVNGKEAGRAGTVGDTEKSTSPQWKYQMHSFDASDTLTIVMQVANYHHEKGGVSQPIHIGLQRDVYTHFNISMGSSILHAGFMMLEGLFFLLFYKRLGKRVILYFALLCITWSFRTAFSNLYPITFLLPDFDWTWQVRIEYITLYMTIVWAALFLHELFLDLSNNLITYLLVGINSFFVLFTIVTLPSTFTSWISFYLGIAGLVIVHGGVLIFRALLIERRGSLFLMSSICIGILLFAYDIIAYQASWSYNPVLMNGGYVVIFLLTTIALLIHLGVLKGSVEKDRWTLKDMYPDTSSRIKS